MENLNKSTATNEAPTNNEETTVKVARRGLGSARGTTRLKFSHEQARPNGLFLAHLDSVAVSTIKIGEDKTGMPSFNGLEVPKIVFTFASNEPEVNKRHYVSLQFTAVESNVNTIPGGKEEWKVNGVLDWLKHVLNVYVLKGRELNDNELDALSLPFTDFDEQGEYVAIEPEDVIAGWKSLFENFEAIINRENDGQPYYKDKGKDVPVWIKLVRYVKSGKKGWTPVSNGDLSFPGFVGEGCIEIYKQNTAPSIRIDSVKECIIPMKIETPKAPNMPNVGMSGVMVGGPIDASMGASASVGFNDNINMEAMEDMPF